MLHCSQHLPSGKTMVGKTRRSPHLLFLEPILVLLKTKPKTHWQNYTKKWFETNHCNNRDSEHFSKAARMPDTSLMYLQPRFICYLQGKYGRTDKTHHLIHAGLQGDRNSKPGVASVLVYTLTPSCSAFRQKRTRWPVCVFRGGVCDRQTPFAFYNLIC